MFTDFLQTPLGSGILRFSLGMIGTLCYFIITQTGFIRTEIDDPSKNPNLYKPSTILFFMIIGGLLPLLFDIRNPLGSFVEGLTIKPTLTYMYRGAKHG